MSSAGRGGSCSPPGPCIDVSSVGWKIAVPALGVKQTAGERSDRTLLPYRLGGTRLDAARRSSTLRLGEVADLRRFERWLNGICVQVSDTAQAPDLADFLRGLRFDVRVLEDRTLEARFGDPHPASRDAREMEFDLYLRVWQAMHPGEWAVRIEGRPPEP
jgi:hypothetical protein